MYKRPEIRSVAIANGGTTSDAFGVADYLVCGIQTPAALTSSTLTFLGSTAYGGTYAPVYDSDGTQVSVSVGTSRAIGISGAEADALSAWPWLKVVMGSAEGAARTLTVSLKG